MDQREFSEESRSILQLVLDTVPVRVFWKDTNSVYLGCNNLFAVDAGYSSVEDVVGKTDYDMPWRAQADGYRADDRMIMQTGMPKLDYEEPTTISDGRTLWLRVSKAPLRDKQDRIIGVIGALMDITERKDAEEALREREALYRTMFEQSPFSVMLNKLSGEIVDVNERFVQLSGWSREEAIGRTPIGLDIIDQATRSAFIDALRRTGKIDAHEIVARTRSGEIVHAQISSALVKIKDQTLVLSILNNITERRRAEMALRESEEKYRELVQNANSIILRWGRDGTIYFFNEFAQRFFGYTEEEILGRNVMDTIVPTTETSGRDLRAMIDEVTAHPELHETSVNENVRKNGERVWIAWTNKPVFDEQGDLIEILSVGLDITERLRNQEALQESEARYRSIFNSHVGAFLLFDTDGRIVDANETAAELYGYTCGELIGLWGKDIVEPGHYNLFEDFQCTRLGEWFNRESAGMRKDGSVFDSEVHGTRLQYAHKDQLLAIVFDITERKKARESMREFYCKTIATATEGKLMICDRETIERNAGPSIATFTITHGEELSRIRHEVTEIAELEGMDKSRVFDLVLCVGEAATNAIKHANGGVVSVHRQDGALLVLVEDNGPGIQAINFPDVALKKGYTTAISLGMGFKAMLSVADQISLATGPDGTTVAIEMGLRPVTVAPVGLPLPDTW